MPCRCTRHLLCGLSITVNRCAHLVPEAEAAWFEANEMSLYAIENHHGRVGVHARTNGVSLRADVHRCFESNAFVFYPAPEGDAKFMAYFTQAEGYPGYMELPHRRLAATSTLAWPSSSSTHASLIRPSISGVPTGPLTPSRTMTTSR